MNSALDKDGVDTDYTMGDWCTNTPTASFGISGTDGNISYENPIKGPTRGAPPCPPGYLSCPIVYGDFTSFCIGLGGAFNLCWGTASGAKWYIVDEPKVQCD